MALHCFSLFADAVSEYAQDIVERLGHVPATAVAEEKGEDVDVDEGVHAMARVVEIELQRGMSTRGDHYRWVNGPRKALDRFCTSAFRP